MIAQIQNAGFAIIVRDVGHRIFSDALNLHTEANLRFQLGEEIGAEGKNSAVFQCKLLHFQFLEVKDGDASLDVLRFHCDEQSDRRIYSRFLVFVRQKKIFDVWRNKRSRILLALYAMSSTETRSIRDEL